MIVLNILITALILTVLLIGLIPRQTVTTTALAATIEPPPEIVDEWTEILAKVREMHAVVCPTTSA